MMRIGNGLVESQVGDAVGEEFGRSPEARHHHRRRRRGSVGAGERVGERRSTAEDVGLLRDEV